MDAQMLLPLIREEVSKTVQREEVSKMVQREEVSKTVQREESARRSKDSVLQHNSLRNTH